LIIAAECTTPVPNLQGENGWQFDLLLVDGEEPPLLVDDHLFLGGIVPARVYKDTKSQLLPHNLKRGY